MRIGVDAGALRHRLTGIGWYLSRVIEHLPAEIKQDDEILLYASRPLTTVPTSRLPLRLRTDRSRLPGTFWLQTRATRLLKHDKPDCFWGPSHFLPLSLPVGIRGVLTVHDIVPVLYPRSMARYNALVHRLYFRKSLTRADAIITVSEQTKRDLVARLGVTEVRITVVPEAADPIFQPLPLPQVQNRLSAMGIGDEYVLAVGTIEPRKNYPLLFRALARLPARFKLVVAGKKGWRYRHILSEVHRLNIEHRVSLLDYVTVENLVALYCGALYVVIPSVYEGFGLPVLEAMACGTPVLASNCSSLPEVGGDAAVYFDPTSVESLVQRMVELAENRVLRNHCREAGMRRARLFSWDKTAEKVMDILRSSPRT